MSSVAESEVTGLFMNTQYTVPICLTLEGMRHLQPLTPLCTDTLTAQEILSGVYMKMNKMQPYKFSLATMS